MLLSFRRCRLRSDSARWCRVGQCVDRDGDGCVEADGDNPSGREVTPTGAADQACHVLRVDPAEAGSQRPRTPFHALNGLWAIPAGVAAGVLYVPSSRAVDGGWAYWRVMIRARVRRIAPRVGPAARNP